MDSQEETILRAIVISSSTTWSGQPIQQNDRQTSFGILADFAKLPGRVPVCLKWLQQPPPILVSGNECTLSAKLYACELLTDFLKKEYTQLPEPDRLQLRHAVLAAARMEATQSRASSTTMANKLASLLASLMVRDFPQRWTSCIDDLFGLWGPNKTVPQMGVKICLDVLRLVAEDCTDSDYNTKISTIRRNDILLGLNEISSQFLPILFQSLEQISTLTQTRASLHNMRTYLVQNQQTLQNMNPEQVAAYQAEESKLNNIAMMIVDTLNTLEKFCYSMPMDWILGEAHNFGLAFIFLMREPTQDINLLALECLELLCLRGKLNYSQWKGWIHDLPSAVQDANQHLTLEMEYLQMQAAAAGESNTSVPDAATVQLSFHRALSRFLAIVVSSHLSHVTANKQEILKLGTSEHASFHNYLRLLVDMLHHPSGRLAGEQMNLWTSLLRDPQIPKTKVLQPFAAELLVCYMDHMVRIRWEDVEEQIHPHFALLEASWDDDEEYDSWWCDYRSRSSQLFKFLANTEPNMAASTMSTRVKTLIANHGNGEPRDHLHPSNQQLTQASDAVRQLEAVIPSLHNILLGLPSWSLTKPDGENPGSREQIRAETRNALSEMANMIVLQWNPTYLWLKFRRAELLDSLKHFWKHDPTTLLQGIDALLTYIRVPDEWDDDGVDELGSRSRVSGETVGLRKRCSSALVGVGRVVPHHLVPWLSQLSEATRALLSSPDLMATCRMHLYEFLSCVATAVEDPKQRANFIENVLSDAMTHLESPESQQAISSVEGFLSYIGVSQASQAPASVTDIDNVKETSRRFQKLYSCFNQLLSVGKRCHEAAKKRPTGGIPLQLSAPANLNNNQAFPDEGPVSIQDLAFNDPFVPLWPRILPHLLKVTDVLLRIWRPENQAFLLRDRIQRYVLAMSDDDAFVSKKNDGKTGGVFGEGGTAGSIIPGIDRRDANLAPRWSSWLTELRNSCFQMFGLMTIQRVLYAPELSQFFPQVVAVLIDPENMRAMEHRHVTQYLKQFTELLMLSCPSTMYVTHLAPIIGPVFEHLQYRLDKTWQPILQSTGSSKPLFTSGCEAEAAVAARGGEQWYLSFYVRSGLFAGDLDAVTAEAAVEKGRIELTRMFSDVLQTVLALKGDWALVLANLAKEDQASRYSEKAKGNRGPPNRLVEGQINADGTPKTQNQAALDARKLHRIEALCHFLFLEHEQIAGFLTLSVIQSLEYPDAYTCRRLSRVCHRILETVAWHPRYTELLGTRMMSVAVKNIVTEPKWMVGIEWDIINVIRDIYGRLCLGQIVQPGGQGAGLQQPTLTQNPLTYEQAKSADRPMQGGGILTTPSDLPRQVFASLPGVDIQMIQKLDEDLKRRRSAKGQKDYIRDFLRVAADNWGELHPPASTTSTSLGVLDRAVEQESLLHNAHKKIDVQDLPEKLVTHSMMKKKNHKYTDPDEEEGLKGFSLF